jgi:hypothetical protein
MFSSTHLKEHAPNNRLYENCDVMRLVWVIMKKFIGSAKGPETLSFFGIGLPNWYQIAQKTAAIQA